MNMRTISPFISIAVILFMAGCSNSTGSGSSGGSSSGSLSGSLAGFVALYLSDGTPTNPVGVTVSIQGTSFSTTSDSTGKWQINDLTTGAYTVLYTKTGYGMSEQQSVQFVGGTDFLGTVYMSQPPPCAISLNGFSSISDSIGFQVGFTIGNITPGCVAVALIAVGKNPDVNAADPTKYLYSITEGNYGPNTLLSIYKQNLYEAGFARGEQAYIVAYTLYQYDGSGSYLNGGSYTFYVDDATGRYVYTSLGTASNVIPLTVP